VPPSALLVGQGGHEFTAEVGNVGDHPAPDQVNMGYGYPEHVSEGHPQVASNGSPPLVGVFTGMWLPLHKDPAAVEPGVIRARSTRALYSASTVRFD
jgi:hypothetical protein